MLFDLFAMVTLDGLATVFNSPFIIPVAGCVMILGMSASSMWAKVRSEEIKSHERLARIAQGLPVDTPTNWDEATLKAAMEAQTGTAATGFVPHSSKINDGSGARRAGVVLTSIGLGLFLFFAMLAATLQSRGVFCGAVAGVLPLAIGIGFLVDAKHKKDDYERRVAAGWYPIPGLHAAPVQPGVAAPVPPPPPVGMTAAQASDWRPLH